MEKNLDTLRDETNKAIVKGFDDSLTKAINAIDMALNHKSTSIDASYLSARLSYFTWGVQVTQVALPFTKMFRTMRMKAGAKNPKHLSAGEVEMLTLARKCKDAVDQCLLDAEEAVKITTGSRGSYPYCLKHLKLAQRYAVLTRRLLKGMDTDLSKS